MSLNIPFNHTGSRPKFPFRQGELTATTNGIKARRFSWAMASEAEIAAQQAYEDALAAQQQGGQ